MVLKRLSVHSDDGLNTNLELRFCSAFFDFRVFNPYAPSNRQPLIVKARPTMFAFRLVLDGAKRILGCSSKTCNEAVRGDMGLDTLQSRRDRAKLKWLYKLATLPEDRYPKQLFNQEWNIKPRRGRQRKVWSKMVDDLFKSLDIDKSEWLEDIKHGDSSSASFMASVKECISSERESRKFEEGLNTKVKLDMYKRFGKSVEFKKYLHGICDVQSRLLFKFRSGTHGLNEELGRHRGREGKMECSLCGNECENVSHHIAVLELAL